MLILVSLFFCLSSPECIANASLTSTHMATRHASHISAHAPCLFSCCRNSPRWIAIPGKWHFVCLGKCWIPYAFLHGMSSEERATVGEMKTGRQVEKEWWMGRRLEAVQMAADLCACWRGMFVPCSPRDPSFFWIVPVAPHYFSPFTIHLTQAHGSVLLYCLRVFPSRRLLGPCWGFKSHHCDATVWAAFTHWYQLSLVGETGNPGNFNHTSLTV